MTTIVTAPTDQITLHDIRWQTYESMLSDLAGRRLRLSYDQGALEIMSPSDRHEELGNFLGRMIEAITEEHNIPLRARGSRTFRRKDLAKGLEPDECYWIQSEALVRGKKVIDLHRDPPPDLVVEIDIHHSSVNRFEIYKALGVPEIWCHDGSKLHLHILSDADGYIVHTQSRCFPNLPMQQLERYLTLPAGQDETTWFRSFRAWVRTIEVRD